MQPRLFQLGNNHLLLNGDSVDSNHLAILHSAAGPLGLGKAELCLTDPPYGVNLGCAESREREQWRIPVLRFARINRCPYLTIT